MIYCRSEGSPASGFTNYFLHENCLEEIKASINFDLHPLFAIPLWQEYTGTTYTDRYCGQCLDSIAPKIPEANGK